MTTSKVPFVDLGPQTQAVRNEVIQRWSKIMDGNSFILGAEVKEFEERFAKYCGARYALGVANGTDALILALRSLNVGPGDEVIAPTNTFVATVEAIAHVGATPVLVDISPGTHNIDVNQLEKFVTPRTKAIIPVHLYGCPADMAPILEVAEGHGIAVIEDAAQAHGATYQGRKAGSMGSIGCFSFYPAKNLGAFGDGGAIVTDREDVVSQVRMLRDHGSPSKYEHDVVGYNSRLDTIQAAVLNAKLGRLDEWNKMRQRNAQIYDDMLAEVPGVVTPKVPQGTSHVFHLYVIRLLSEDRERVRQRLQERGVQTGIHYPMPVHLTKAFRHLGYREGSFPVAEEVSQQILSLPMYPELQPDQIYYVVQQLKECLGT